MPEPPGATLVFRRALPSDRAALRQLLADLRITVAGSSKPLAQRALIEAGLRDPRLVMLVVDDAGVLVGVAYGVIHPRRFWREMALRSPWLLGERAFALIGRKLRRSATDGAQAADPVDLPRYLSLPSGRHWGESSETIAQTGTIKLRPELRGDGLGTRFFGAFIDEVAQAGARRLDSRIARGNIASVRMVRGCGCSVEDAGAVLFATIDLPRSGS